MFREQMIHFLEAAVVFLLATNAFSVLAALYAFRLANAGSLEPKADGVIAHRLDAMIRPSASIESTKQNQV